MISPNNKAIGATGSGGAISITKQAADTSILNINTGCTFSTNSAKNGGAIIFKLGNTEDSINIENCTFTENTASPNNSTHTSGGAIFAVINGIITAPILNVIECDFGTSAISPIAQPVTEPPPDPGGAIFLDSVTLNATGCNFYGNTSNYGIGVGGGAVYANISGSVPFNVNLTDCVYRGNSAGNFSASGGACFI